MTDDDGFEDALPDDVPGFDDPAYADLRGLLAEARVTDPMPADLADRLDEAFAVLDRDRPVPASSSTIVVPLRPRRTTGSRLLVAAAVVGAVAVGGLGLSKIVEDHGSTSTVADSAADAGTAGVGGSRSSTDSAEGADLAALPALSSASFDRDTVRFLTQVDPATADMLGQAGSATRAPTAEVPQAVTGSKSADGPQALRDLAALRATGCTPPTAGSDASYAILLDGRPAILVVRTAADGSYSARALSCSGEVLAETTGH